MKLKYVLVTCVAAMGFVACSGDQNCDTALQQRVQALEQQIKNDSLLMESIDRDFEEIGTGLATAMQFTNEAASGIMTKSQYKERIQSITQTLQDNSQKIAELTKELQNAKGSAKNAKLLLKQLAEKDQQIASLLGQIEQLNSKMAAVESENVGLKATVAEKNTQISSMSGEIDEARNELSRLQSQIAQAKSQTAKAQNDLTDSYLNAGVLMMEIADKIDGVFKPKAKAEATQQAFEFFCAAHKRGHYNALTYISQLKSDKEFSKHLRGKNCD